MIFVEVAVLEESAPALKTDAEEGKPPPKPENE